MIRSATILLVIVALFGMSSARADEIIAKVVYVNDGDTITIRTAADQKLKIRLFGVDCPEVDQPYGKKAKWFTYELVFGQRVKVWPVGKDSDGRMVGWVFTKEKSLNKELLLAGLAWHYKRYSSDAVLASMEMKARAARKGLWADPDPVPPWEFRKSSAK
jgi:endonuclease YncB( thermonuclease family)